MRRLRTLSKSCPKCEAGVAVASRICGECGFAFARQTRSSVSGNPGTSTGVTKKGESQKVSEQRRTGRVRIAKKPNYYDSQEFEKKKKKERVTRGSKNILCNKRGKETETTKVKETTEARAKRRRAKKEEEEGRDMLEKIPLEKQELAKIILSEINRKMFSVVWKPSE